MPNILQITVRELLDTDIIVLNPNARPAHVIREENLEIVRQRYGVYFHYTQMVDGINTGRHLRTLRYTDRVWVERTTEGATCGFEISDGNVDDPSFAYCGHPVAHGGGHGNWSR